MSTRILTLAWDYNIKSDRFCLLSITRVKLKADDVVIERK